MTITVADEADYDFRKHYVRVLINQSRAFRLRAGLIGPNPGLWLLDAAIRNTQALLAYRPAQGDLFS